jgi:hypothetical protein
MHFTRARAPITQCVPIGGADVEPQAVARFLGVWLDRKTRQFALTRLAVSPWGCSLHRARMLYTAVIRSAAAYGAAAYEVLAAPKPRGSRRGAGKLQWAKERMWDGTRESRRPL